MRVLRAELGVLRAETPGALASLATTLGEAIGSDRALAFSYDDRGGYLCVAECSAQRVWSLRERMNAFLAAQPPVGWTAYNPLRPAPWDRNRTRSLREILLRYGDRFAIRGIYPLLGIDAMDQLRVVPCDGSSMLAYVTLFQDEPFDDDQKTALQSLVPPLRRRLALERALVDAPTMSGALDETLDRLGAPAWIVRPGGRVMRANRAGRASLDADRADVHARLRAAIVGDARAGLEVTAVTGRGEPDAWLVIDRAQTGSPEAHARVRAFAAELSLSPRLAQVLELVARGLANRTISAELRISEATVEQYVTALLVRAGVESRAALIARILWGHDA
jgi:DNA-binding CsgD family transcriptional regulator